MKVFISWSGSKSRALAVALSEWLPAVINSVEPFVSSRDIDAGTRWQLELAEQLESTNFGIVCVTQENQREPWLNFEAGALAKAVNTSRVVPLALDLKPSDLELPLGQFQAQAATEPGVTDVLRAINAASDAPLSQPLLERAATKWWPDLKAELDKIEQEAAGPSSRVHTQERTDRELLEETLDTVRSLARSIMMLPSGADARATKERPILDQLGTLLADYVSEIRVPAAASGAWIEVLPRRRIPRRVQEEATQLAALHGYDLLIHAAGYRRRLEADREAAGKATEDATEEK